MKPERALQACLVAMASLSLTMPLDVLKSTSVTGISKIIMDLITNGIAILLVVTAVGGVLACLSELQR